MQVNNSTSLDYCPLCKSRNIYQKGNLDYCGKVDYSTNAITLSHHPALWKCRQCLSCFVQRIVNEETARMLYSTGQAGKRWSTVIFDQSKTRSVIDCMTAIFKNKGRVLDIGCNTGELLDFAHGFGCKTSGVEFSTASIKTLVDKGHAVYSRFEDALGEYDVITAFDLVEHLYTVPDFLSACRERLAEKGALIILTGNIDSLSAALASTHWWYAQYPEHVVFPSKKFFSEYSGWRVEKWIPTYASKGYQNSTYKIVWGILKNLLRGRAYTGLPSLGPDHVLVVLSK